jgi:hypothetical protein
MDHDSLKWLHSFREPEGQVAHWLEVLSEYDFTIVHQPVAKYSNVDALSRSNWSRYDTQDVNINPTAASVTSLASDNWLGTTSLGCSMSRPELASYYNLVGEKFHPFKVSQEL